MIKVSTEKAKTSRQIIDKCVGTNKWKLDYEITGSNAPDLTEKWVRLEDARQEIDKLKDDCKEKSEGYAKVCARLHERIIDLERERGEQKQKLSDVIHSYLVAYPLKTKLDREVCKVLRGIAKDMGLME